MFKYLKNARVWSFLISLAKYVANQEDYEVPGATKRHNVVRELLDKFHIRMKVGETTLQEITMELEKIVNEFWNLVKRVHRLLDRVGIL